MLHHFLVGRFTVMRFAIWAVALFDYPETQEFMKTQPGDVTSAGTYILTVFPPKLINTTSSLSASVKALSLPAMSSFTCPLMSLFYACFQPFTHIRLHLLCQSPFPLSHSLTCPLPPDFKCVSAPTERSEPTVN